MWVFSSTMCRDKNSLFLTDSLWTCGPGQHCRWKAASVDLDPNYSEKDCTTGPPGTPGHRVSGSRKRGNTDEKEPGHPEEQRKACSDCRIWRTRMWRGGGGGTNGQRNLPGTWQSLLISHFLPPPIRFGPPHRTQRQGIKPRQNMPMKVEETRGKNWTWTRCWKSWWGKRKRSLGNWTQTLRGGSKGRENLCQSCLQWSTALLDEIKGISG